MTSTRAQASASPARDLRRWFVQRGSLAIGDQAVAALSALLVHIFLARALQPEHYGAFAVSQAVYGFIVDGFGVVFCEPMTVLLQNRARAEQDDYLGALVHVHLFASLAIGAFVALGYPLWSQAVKPLLGHALLAMAFAAPCMLLLPLARRIGNARFALQVALATGAAAFALLLALLFALRHAQQLTAASAYAALGSASAVAGLIALARLRALSLAPKPRAAYRAVFRAHESWVRWGIPNVLARWFPLNAYYVMVPLLMHGEQGLAAAGRLRAIMTLALPVLQIQSALSSSLLPTLARDDAAMRNKNIARLLALVLGTALCYGVMLGLFGGRVAPRVFGPAYAIDQSALWWAGATLIASGAASVLRIALLAAHEPRRVFLATALSAAASVTLGSLLTARFALHGALMGMTLASAVQAAALWRERRAA